MADNKNKKQEKLTAYQFGERVGLNSIQVRALQIKYKEKSMPKDYWEKQLKKNFNL